MTVFNTVLAIFSVGAASTGRTEGLSPPYAAIGPSPACPKGLWQCPSTGQNPGIKCYDPSKELCAACVSAPNLVWITGSGYDLCPPTQTCIVHALQAKGFVAQVSCIDPIVSQPCGWNTCDPKTHVCLPYADSRTH
eukprot:306458_1